MKIKKVARKLEKMGTNGDTVLAHINEDEAAMLKDAGGSGKRNPKTGLLSFYGGDPEGNADAGRGDGMAGAEGQGGFGGPDMGGGFGDGGLLSFSGIDPEGSADAGRVNGSAGVEMQGGFGGPSLGSGSGSGKPGESAMAQAAATSTGIAPSDLPGLQRSMVDSMGGQYSEIMNGILGGLFGPLGVIGGKMFGIGDRLSNAFAEHQVMNTPFGGGGGGMFGGGGGESPMAEGGMGGDLIGGGVGGGSGAPPTPPASMIPPKTQQPFVSKWGKPRTRGYFGG